MVKPVKKIVTKKTAEPVTRKDPFLYDHFGESEYIENKFERYLKEFTFSRKELFQIRKAYDFSRLAHQNQFRDEAYPFFLHPIRVTNILLHELKTTSADMICGGLLHDVIEHCPVTLKELRNNFNETVASYVKTMTKPTGPAALKTDYFESIRQADSEIRIIKLCDRLDNCRALRFNNNKVKLRRFLKDLKFRYLPMAKEISPYIHQEFLTEQTVMQNRLRSLQKKSKIQ